MLDKYFLLPRFCTVLLGLFFLASSVGVAKTMEPDVLPPAPGKEVTIADVFYAVQLIDFHIERLRRHMGEPEANLLDIGVSKATPSDVYFQAMALFQKTNRLLFEIVRQNKQLPPMPNGIVCPADILVLVNEAHRSIHQVMDNLNVREGHVDLVRDETKTATDVFLALLKTNRQVNQLLERRFSPSDVYQEVTLAIGYAARQLARYPYVRRIPAQPPFVKERKPNYVYFHLLKCMKIISRIHRLAGLDMLEIDSSRINEKSITPSDVFDIAALVVARLDFLHKSFAVTKPPREVYYSGRKYPSDVCQHVGILEKQLLQFEGLMAGK